MSSYYPSFNYMGLNSLKDKNLIVVHFESGDSGEMDTFLGMDPIYTDNPYGTMRIDYGAKYNSVAVIRISVIKSNGADFSVPEVRDFLKWTTGARQNSYLDLVDDSITKASFLGRITAVYQQKLDARTIGFTIEHTSVSPWAYSPQQFIKCSFGQNLIMDENGILSKSQEPLSVDSNGILTNGSNAMFDMENDGTIYIDNSTMLQINNFSDDLYSYVGLDTKLENGNSDHITIKNQTLYEKSNGQDGQTEIVNMAKNEVIQLSSGQFITSNAPNKIFGDDFNFIWPKLLPGVNNMVISGSGNGAVEFTYRYPIKIGDCAVDFGVASNGFNGCDCPEFSGSISGPVSWDEIIDTPTTLKGYGITDAYTDIEVDNKIESVDPNVNNEELNQMLEETLN